MASEGEQAPSVDDEAIYFAAWTEQRKRTVRATVTIGLSVLAHVVALVILVRSRREAALPAGPPVVAFVADEARVVPATMRAVALDDGRRALVRRARAAIERRDFSLGAFLLEANAIDAREEGVSFDEAEAKQRYAARVATLREALKSAPPEDAVPVVFEDLSYKGTPGGRMADALLSRSGSCEPLSHLVVAALYDAGVKERAYFRYYGGRTAGVSHLAPVIAFLDEARRPVRAHDLMTGREAARGGVNFHASELVSVYARAHGLIEVAREDSGFGAPAGGASARDASGPFGLGAVPTTRTLSSGYPPNEDRFVGALPLFSERAVAPRRGAGGEEDLPEVAPPCAVFLSIAWLDPPRAFTGARADVPVELVKLPSKSGLDHLSSLIQMVEAAGDAPDLPSRLVQSACLAGLYHRAGLAFSLSGQPAVSKRAVGAARRARTAGARDLEVLARLPVEERLRTMASVEERTMGRSWVLVFLPGGDDVLLDYVREAGPPLVRSPLAKVLPMTALLVNPATRERAIALTAEVPTSVWPDIMAELIHAHDDARPWSAIHRMSYAGEAEGAPRFVRTYRVFAQLAWRLWEAGRPPEEVVSALLEDAEREALGVEEVEPIAAYYLRHASILMASRAEGQAAIERAHATLGSAGVHVDLP